MFCILLEPVIFLHLEIVDPKLHVGVQSSALLEASAILSIGIFLTCLGLDAKLNLHPPGKRISWALHLDICVVIAELVPYQENQI